ncbi:MAG: hypothetical protein MRK01_02200 [Candidatus Scalindua sp.]|nr:hypothetical protein [Candidatus Scalindua sp.]
MNFNDLHFLTKLSTSVQVTAIVLIFFGGLLQASRFFIDKKINGMKMILEKAEKSKTDEAVNSLDRTILAQRAEIELQSKKIELQQTKIHEVDTKIAHRFIPRDKLTILRDELSKYKGEKVDIFTVTGDQESYNFALELKSLFESAGWKVTGVGLISHSRIMKNLIFNVKNDNSRQKAEILIKLLDFAGFSSICKMNNMYLNDLVLVVGFKE